MSRLATQPDSSPRISLSRRLYQLINDRGVDFAPIDGLARALDVDPSAVRAAAARAPYLGICRSDGELMLFCLPPTPFAAGFRAEVRHGRLMLRLPGHDRRPALLLSGQRIGPVPVKEREDTVGSGELAHFVSRLALLARTWLPPTAPDQARHLFELIAEAWRHGPAPRQSGRAVYGVHQVDFNRPVAWPNGTPSDRLELVLNSDGDHQQLVNIYPTAGEGNR